MHFSITETILFHFEQDARATLLLRKKKERRESIPAKHLDQVREMVLESVRKGRDLGGLLKGLEEEFGITRRRAVVISRDQNNKATEMLMFKHKMQA